MLFDIHGPYTSIQKSVNSNANSNSNAWKKDIRVICGPIFVTFTPTLRKKKNFRQNLTYSTFNYPLSILITEFSFKSEKRTEQIENEQKMNRF